MSWLATLIANSTLKAMKMMTPIEEKRLANDAQMREVYDLRVFVVGGGFQYTKMFFDAGFKGARSVDDADIVCFTGGEDVDPAFYSEKPIPGTNFNSRRDEIEAYIYGEAIALSKPMIGICRGSQFLNVMNGGRLWQDVNNHCNGPHVVTDVRTGELKHNMTSTHHQQMIAGDGATIIAAAILSTKKKSEIETLTRVNPNMDDMEVLWYADTTTLCFQPHPEFYHGECRNYFLDLVDDLILPAC